MHTCHHSASCSSLQCSALDGKPMAAAISRASWPWCCRLVGAAFLCAEADKNAVLRHRQLCPTRLSEPRRSDCRSAGSAFFAHHRHFGTFSSGASDPLGENLQRLATALRHYTANGVDRWGVCWYFSSLHMHPDEANGELRNVMRLSIKRA